MSKVRESEQRANGAGERSGRRSAVCRRTAAAALILAVGMLAGCGGSQAAAEQASSAGSAEIAVEPASAEQGWTVPDAGKIDYDGAVIRVGSLKGPTTMGLVNLMKASDEGDSVGQYTFDMESDPSAIAAAVVSGNLDVALLPANLAATLYNKTNGGVKAADINTLGVLYCVTGDEDIHSMKDLAGKTVLTTGQGATPEYVLDYLLSAYGVTDCTPEFHSEAAEIAAVLKEDPEKIAVLPQPFVTAAEAQNEALQTAFSLTDAWDEVTEDGSRLLTGATIVRTDFLEKNPEAVMVFEAEHRESAARAVSDVDGTAQLVADYGIIEKAPVAKKALPQCGIVCIEGEEMKTAMMGYYQVLLEASPDSVGGNVPADDFYDTETAGEEK